MLYHGLHVVIMWLLGLLMDSWQCGMYRPRNALKGIILVLICETMKQHLTELCNGQIPLFANRNLSNCRKIRNYLSGQINKGLVSRYCEDFPQKTFILGAMW